MLIEDGSVLYAYAITRDLGFAPNPFHGFCTLATCKPGVRKGARVGDWVLGVGGSKLRGVTRKCILLMKVTSKITFQEYWDNPRYSIKKPLRNGSRVKMLGDNIYHKDCDGGWIQEDSHHSQSDGSIHQGNLRRDLKSNNVLISNYFLYFGRSAIEVDLDSIGYHRRIRDYVKMNLNESDSGKNLIELIIKENRNRINLVIADPCQFSDSHKRADQTTGMMT